MFLSMLSKLPPGVCWRGGGGGVTGLLNKGGGSNRLPGVVTKQQAVEFPQVQTSNSYYCKLHLSMHLRVLCRAPHVPDIGMQLNAII